MSLHAMNYFAIATMQRGEFEKAAHLFLNIIKNLKNDLNANPLESKENLDVVAHEREPYQEGRPTRKRRKTEAVAPSPVDVNLFYSRLVHLYQKEDVENPGAEKEDGTESTVFSSSLPSHCEGSPAKPLNRITSMSDTADLICTSAIATFPGSGEATSASTNVTSRTGLMCSEDQILFNTSVLSGALLYNTGLCFHLEWFKAGQSSNLRNALKFYEAARNILQTAFSLATTADSQKDIVSKNNDMKQSHVMVDNVGMILLALVNNMSAIFHENIQIHHVHQLREEMRYIFQMIDPIVAFGADSEACTSLYMNAFFYGENQDMNAARAA